MAVVKYLHAHPSRHAPFCAVRPSDLTDGEAREYTLHATLQNNIFNAGATTRANVGAFMADCVTKDAVWATWRNAYPHILDVAVPKPGEKKAA